MYTLRQLRDPLDQAGRRSKCPTDVDPREHTVEAIAQTLGVSRKTNYRSLAVRMVAGPPARPTSLAGERSARWAPDDRPCAPQMLWVEVSTGQYAATAATFRHNDGSSATSTACDGSPTARAPVGMIRWLRWSSGTRPDVRTSSPHPRLRRVRWPRRCRDLALHGRTGYGGTCAGASAPIFTEPSYLEPKIRSGNAVWSPETFAKFFVKRARCAPVLIVGLLLSPRRRAPWLSCDGCSAVPRRWARHMGGVNRPCTMALMLHGTAAGLGGGPGQLPPRSESHPSSAARARSASGVSAKPSPARQRCAPLGPPGSGQAWPVEPPVVLR